MSMAPHITMPHPIQVVVDTRVNDVRLLVTKVVFEEEKTSYPAEMIQISDKKRRKKTRKICLDIINEIIDTIFNDQKPSHLNEELTTEDTITYDVLGLPKNFGGRKIRKQNKRSSKTHRRNDTDTDYIDTMDEASAAEYWNNLYQTNPEYYYQLYYSYYPEAAQATNDGQLIDPAPLVNDHVPMTQCMNSGGSGTTNNSNDSSNQSNNTNNTSGTNQSSTTNTVNSSSSGQSGGDGDDNNNNNNRAPFGHADDMTVDVVSDEKEEDKASVEMKSPTEIMDRKYSLIEKIMQEMQDDTGHKEIDAERMQLMMEEIKDADLDYEDIKERMAKAPAKIKDNGEFSIFSGHRVVFESSGESDDENEKPVEPRAAVLGVVGEGVVEEGELESDEDDEDETLPPLVQRNNNNKAADITIEVVAKEKDTSDSESEPEPLDPAEAAYEEIKRELETVETKMSQSGKFSLFEGKHVVFEPEGSDDEEVDTVTPVKDEIERVIIGEGEVNSDDEADDEGGADEDQGEDDGDSSESMEVVHIVPEPKAVQVGKGHVKFDYSDSDSDSEDEDQPMADTAPRVVGTGTVEMNDDIRFYDEDDSDYKQSEEEFDEAEEDYEEEEEGYDEEEENVLKDAFTEQEEKDLSTEKRVDKSLMKYWAQRYSLFSKFDEGIQMDTEGWYSVTPEEIARHIAARMYQRLGPNATVIDAMAGVGGNTVQFASMFPLVFGMELDPQRALMAKNNAEVYGVDSNIEFVIGDYTCLAPHFRADAVFLSPPWGGPGYLKQEKFDIETMPLNGVDLFRLTEKITKNIGYFLPRNTDASQLTQLAGPGESCEIEQNYLYDKLKTITAYYGDLVWVNEENTSAEPAEPAEPETKL